VTDIGARREGTKHLPRFFEKLKLDKEEKKHTKY
jgi:hypothetical protein